MIDKIIATKLKAKYGGINKSDAAIPTACSQSLQSDLYIQLYKSEPICVLSMNDNNAIQASITLGQCILYLSNNHIKIGITVLTAIKTK